MSDSAEPKDQQRDWVCLKFDWLDQVSQDRRLPPMAGNVAIALTTFFNRQTRQAWPSTATLAEQLSISTRTVRTIIGLMLERGYLTVIGDRRGGLNHTNRYQLRLDPEKVKAMNNNGKTPKGGSSVPSLAERRKPASSFDAKGGSRMHERRKERVTKGGSLLPPNPLTEPLEEPSSTELTKMDAKGWFRSDTRSEARILAYELFKATPPRVLDIDVQIDKFTEHNRQKRLTDEDWRSLWRAWCEQAVAFVRRASA